MAKENAFCPHLELVCMTYLNQQMHGLDSTTMRNYKRNPCFAYKKMYSFLFFLIADGQYRKKLCIVTSGSLFVWLFCLWEFGSLLNCPMLIDINFINHKFSEHLYWDGAKKQNKRFIVLLRADPSRTETSSTPTPSWHFYMSHVGHVHTW